MRSVTFFVVCCVIAAIAPLFVRQTTNSTESVPFPGWPAQFEGRALTEQSLSLREKQFTESFPGRIARFTDGSRELIFRWVTRETRALHPAADCFRGIGYSIRPLPLHTDIDGNRWGAFEASRKGETLLVRERIYSAGSGQSWPDVSGWYWQTTFDNLQSNRQGWWAVTVAEHQ